MAHPAGTLLLACTLAACRVGGQNVVAPPVPDPIALSTVALRVNRMEAMTRFYSEAFDVEFREVDTFGVTSRFGEAGGITLKLVPIRESVDFEGFPDAQLGFEVPSIAAVVDLANDLGGRQEGELRETEGGLHACVRDPDGNTVELYQRASWSDLEEARAGRQ